MRDSFTDVDILVTGLGTDDRKRRNERSASEFIFKPVVSSATTHTCCYLWTQVVASRCRRRQIVLFNMCSVLAMINNLHLEHRSVVAHCCATLRYDSSLNGNFNKESVKNELTFSF